MGHYFANPDLLPEDWDRIHWRVFCTGINGDNQIVATAMAIRSLTQCDAEVALDLTKQNSKMWRYPWTQGSSNSARNARKAHNNAIVETQKAIAKGQAKRAFLKHQLQVLSPQFFELVKDDQHSGMRG